MQTAPAPASGPPATMPPVQPPPRCEKCGRYPIDHRDGECIYPPSLKAALTDFDRSIIARARQLGPTLRARNGDRDRLAGWLLAELADLAERLAPDRTSGDLPRREGNGSS